MIRARIQTSRNGFSIIELMIALFLGALVVAGLINVLIANRQAYRLQEATNYNQQNMRFAMDRIGWSLRMADFWGGVASTNITGTPAVTGTGSCDATWILNVAQGIYGYDGAATFPLAGCVNNANYVPGTDVLVLRYADTDAVDPAAALIPNKIYLQAQTGARGILFANTRPAALPNATLGVSTYPYGVEAYYLRPCSDPGPGGLCGAGSDGGRPIPTLMRLHLNDAGGLISEPVVEGIEQLQFEYGLRADKGTPTPTVYKSASKMTAPDWDNVIAVRIGYVLRAQTRDVAVPHTFDTNPVDPTNALFPARLSNDCQYSIAADGTVTIAAPPGDCDNGNFNTASVGNAQNPAQQFARSLMTSVVQLRNRMRQP